ncbi:xenotropic and polytropic retrovirus receptor 1-like isoform X1 [Octopus vulgaris]|uniref:Xenotropic and polytropic retrovirus receptor 1-like isoform X1 n=1 Tax=Octopus vulgaris TaxID=6645 RepID=A0AA36AK73_OCTVU|nr:xenotropic and polytropic retrovirus receptor 1-like isoform X1 [Octopus vulgaris]
MKFAEHLGAHITPEWRKQYIQYEVMKSMLYEAQEQAPSSEVTDSAIIKRYFTRFDESFFQFCEKELTKINTFFSEKFAEATRKFATLNAELQEYSQLEEKAMHRPSLRRRRGSVHVLFKEKNNKVINTRKMHDLKLAFSEFYLSLILLQNYQTLNFTGFRKIFKKHDKLFQTTNGVEWRMGFVDTAHFYVTKEVDQLIKETEQIVTTDLEGGNRQKAMKRLRVPPLGEKPDTWVTFRVGLFSGIFCVLLLVIILAAIFTKHSSDWEPALRIYRGPFLLILDVFLLGMNTYGWRTSGVNHVLIFELDPRNHLTHQQLLETASGLSVLWAASVLLYLFSNSLNIPAFISPFTLVIILVAYLINPLQIFHHRARFWLIRILLRIVSAPFHHVGFADFWLADQLNSLAPVMLDFYYFICFYAIVFNWQTTEYKTASTCLQTKYGIRAIVNCLPAWFRFAQCLRRYNDTHLKFPHIVNAGKYATTFLVVIFHSIYKMYKEKHAALPDAGSDEMDVSYETEQTIFYYTWIVALLISSCYTFTWDIKMDWGLLEKTKGENKFLREECVYAYSGYYYFAILEDFILRFIWTLKVSVIENGMVQKEVASTILMILEVFRRFIWNYFRLENEHLNNCGQFRAVRDISIAPIESNDQALLMEMMDDPDGLGPRKYRDRFMERNRKDPKIWMNYEDDND